MKLVKKISFIVCLLILLINTTCFAATDQFRAFKTWDYEADNIGTTQADAVNTAVSFAVWTFQDLGYTNAGGVDTYTTTNDKQYLFNNWLNISGNNYGFYIYAHGNRNLFTLEKNNSDRYVYPSEISGNWHLVFLDCCSCLETNAFATRFKTDGYSNRATLGWYKTVTHSASAEWWGHFNSVAGSTNIRSACLSAADQSQNTTPIRMYGDTSWSGRAW